jgi:hypothetical protein
LIKYLLFADSIMHRNAEPQRVAVRWPENGKGLAVHGRSSGRSSPAILKATRYEGLDPSRGPLVAFPLRLSRRQSANEAQRIAPRPLRRIPFSALDSSASNLDTVAPRNSPSSRRHEILAGFVHENRLATDPTLAEPKHHHSLRRDAHVHVR